MVQERLQRRILCKSQSRLLFLYGTRKGGKYPRVATKSKLETYGRPRNRQCNGKQSCTRLISIGQVIPTWQVVIASICSKLRSPGSCLLKVNTFMGQLLKSSTIIPESGIYRVIHSQHRLPHEVTLIGGQTFPPCGKCHEEVRFELVRELPELERERRGHVSLYSLPALDEEEG